MQDQFVKIAVHFEPREDGGLSVWSEDLPGLHLSHRDPVRVLHDVKAALEELISNALGVRAHVEPLVGIREVLHPESASEQQVPTGIREYASRMTAA